MLAAYRALGIWHRHARALRRRLALRFLDLGTRAHTYRELFLLGVAAAVIGSEPMNWTGPRRSGLRLDCRRETVWGLGTLNSYGVVDQVPARKAAPAAPPVGLLPTRLETTQTEVLAISAAHALRITDLPEHHRDPFDRMIVARALSEGARVLTADRTLAKHDVELLRP